MGGWWDERSEKLYKASSFWMSLIITFTPLSAIMQAAVKKFSAVYLASVAIALG
jgi:hypothetical protein